jgi:hypothetical protein
VITCQQPVLPSKTNFSELFCGQVVVTTSEKSLYHVFNDLKIEASKSPDVTLFTRLRNNWDLLPHTSEQAAIFRPTDYSPEAQKLLALIRADTLASVAGVSEFVRDDYCEFKDLSIVFLGAADVEIHYRRPGALHKARWMAKMIYSLKIALAEKIIEQLLTGTVTVKNQMMKIREFSTFITHVYCM